MLVLTRVGNFNAGTSGRETLWLQRAEHYLLNASSLLPNTERLHQDIIFARIAQGFEGDTASLLAGTEEESLIADMLIRYGDYALSAKYVDDAAIWYQKAAQAFPDRWEPWYRIGRIAKLKENLSGEILAYQKALSLNADINDVWYALGITYEEHGDVTSAITAYEQGVSALSGHVGKSNLYYRIGKNYQTMADNGHWSKAWNAYSDASRINDFTPGPEHLIITLRQKGQLLAEKGRWAEAAAQYQEAMALDPANYWVHIEMAQALWALHRQSEALSLLQTAITINPENVNAYRFLGDYYRAEGAIDQARDAYHKLLEIDPTSEPTRRKLAEINGL